MVMCLTPSASALDLETTELAFGRLPVGGSRCRAVSVSNRTPRTVTITRISTTCGCATGSVGHAVLAPGDSTELLVTAKPTREGRDAGSLFLYTDDRTMPQVVLSVSVEGFKPLQVEPAFVQFGDVPLGQEQRKSFQVALADGRPVRITGLHCNTGLFAAAVRSQSAAEGRAQAWVDVTLKCTAPAGMFRESLTLDVAGDPPQACVVALYGHVRSDLAVTPASLLFLSVTPGSRPSRTVQLSSRAGRPLEILSLESDLASLSTRWEPQAGGTVVITAVLDATALQENASGTLLVRTGDATQPELKIPVRVYLRR
jgi:hypothetical protein